MLHKLQSDEKQPAKCGLFFSGWVIPLYLVIGFIIFAPNYQYIIPRFIFYLFISEPMSEQVNTTLQSLKQPVFLDLSPEFVFRTYSNTHLTHLKSFYHSKFGVKAIHQSAFHVIFYFHDSTIVKIWTFKVREILLQQIYAKL